MADCGEGGTKAGLSGGHAGCRGRAYPAWETTVGLLVGVRVVRVTIGGGVVVVALRGWRASSVLRLWQLFLGGSFVRCYAVCLVLLFVCLNVLCRSVLSFV